MVIRRRGMAVALALAADRRWGEPPVDPHPVAAFGTLMARVEERLHRDRRVAGVAHLLVGAGIAAAAGATVRSTAAVTYTAVAARGLGDAALTIGRVLEQGDLAAARRFLPTLAGRDPSVLDEAGIARAVVESVAENTVDAVVAPVWWALVAGAPGAAVHRAVNTLDAMVGHHTERNERFGWASARADDAMAWIPARLTAALVALARPARARAIGRAVRDDAPAHPSPNAGVAEAAFAAALDLHLGGTTDYGDRIEERPRLGAGRTVDVGDIRRAVDLLRDVTDLAAAGCILLAVLPHPRGTRGQVR